LNTVNQRIISGTVYVSLIIGSICISRFSFLIFFSLITMFSLLEFYRVSLRSRVKAHFILGTVTGAVIFIVNFLFACQYANSNIFLFILPFILSFYFVEIYKKDRSSMSNLAYTIFGLIYVVIPFSLLNYFVFPHADGMYTKNIILGFFILVWASDSGAFVFGTTFGRHKLMPRLSPKKTWEGLIGGLLFTVFVSVVISKYFTELQMYHWVVCGVIISIAGMYGDLAESMFKRSIKIKDTGNILPGHGGLLDRFDSFLLAVPAVFFYLHWVLF
jgi:phosphatidate cytidylyltransferase